MVYHLRAATRKSLRYLCEDCVIRASLAVPVEQTRCVVSMCMLEEVGQQTQMPNPHWIGGSREYSTFRSEGVKTGAPSAFLYNVNQAILEGLWA